MLTYLDSLMIENPAFFDRLNAKELSAASLTAVRLGTGGIRNLTDITNLGDINNEGTISTSLLSAQDIITRDLEVKNEFNAEKINVNLLSSTNIINKTDITNRGDIFNEGKITTSLLSSANIINKIDITNKGNFINEGSIENEGEFVNFGPAEFQDDIIGEGNFDLRTGRAEIFSLSARFLSAEVGKFKTLEVLDEEDVRGVLYVSLGGSDGNTGKNIFSPLRTIKKACEIAHNEYYRKGNPSLSGIPDRNRKYTIFVGSGDFYEENPIYIPPNVSIIGDNLRRSSIYPLHKSYDIFWCNTSIYVWGFTFRGHCEPAACTAFPDFDTSQTARAIALRNLIVPKWSNGAIEWRYPYITTSPYIQGSSSIARMLTAGSSAQPFRFQTTNVQQTATPTWTSSVDSIALNVHNLFDDITFIMLSGLNTRGSRSFTAGTNSTQRQAWADVIQSNENFIAWETEAFAAAVSARGEFPHLRQTGGYDKAKCRRDVGYILSAVRTDIVNGNNTQSLFNANRYYLHSNGAGTPEVTGDGAQVAATISSIEFAKKLVLDITKSPNTRVPFLGTGAGMRVDGTKAEGFLRSFVLDSFTQFNEGGLGIHIIKNGYAQLVSIFTICCTAGLLAESGGQMSVNNSNCSFGLSGIAAVGKSTTPVLTGILLNNILDEPQPDQVWIEKCDGTIQVPNSKYVSEGAVIGVDTRKLVTSPYNGMVFTIGNDPTLYAIRDQPLQIKTFDDLSEDFQNDINKSTWYTNGAPGRGRVFQLASTTFILGAPTDANGNPVTGLNGQPVTNANYTAGAELKFYLRSTITTSSHTMEYIGSGILLEQAVPGLGGRAIVANEAVSVNGGGTYYTSTDQVGNFRVGPGFTIVQETGLIEGDTFKRAMLALMTPLILALE